MLSRAGRRNESLVTGRPQLVHCGHMGIGERQPGRGERPQGEVQHDHGVLAAREQQHRALELGHHLTDDVDALALERR